MTIYNVYYVYMYLREDATPYYVGKGKNSRYKQKHNVPVPDEKRIVFIQKNMRNKEALELEKKLISQYGRKDLGTGILRNLTDGGDGASNPSAESRRKMSEAKKGYVPWNAGKTGVQKHSKEARIKMSLAKLGKSNKPNKPLKKCGWCGEIAAKNMFCSKSCSAKYRVDKKRKMGIPNGFQNKDNLRKALNARLGPLDYTVEPIPQTKSSD